MSTIISNNQQKLSIIIAYIPMFISFQNHINGTYQWWIPYTIIIISLFIYLILNITIIILRIIKSKIIIVEKLRQIVKLKGMKQFEYLQWLTIIYNIMMGQIGLQNFGIKLIISIHFSFLSTLIQFIVYNKNKKNIIKMIFYNNFWHSIGQTLLQIYLPQITTRQINMYIVISYFISFGEIIGGFICGTTVAILFIILARNKLLTKKKSLGLTVSILIIICTIISIISQKYKPSIYIQQYNISKNKYMDMVYNQESWCKKLEQNKNCMFNENRDNSQCQNQTQYLLTTIRKEIQNGYKYQYCNPQLFQMNIQQNVTDNQKKIITSWLFADNIHIYPQSSMTDQFNQIISGVSLDGIQVQLQPGSEKQYELNVSSEVFSACKFVNCAINNILSQKQVFSHVQNPQSTDAMLEFGDNQINIGNRDWLRQLITRPEFTLYLQQYINDINMSIFGIDITVRYIVNIQNTINNDQQQMILFDDQNDDNLLLITANYQSVVLLRDQNYIPINQSKLSIPLGFQDIIGKVQQGQLKQDLKNENVSKTIMQYVWGWSEIMHTYYFYFQIQQNLNPETQGNVMLSIWPNQSPTAGRYIYNPSQISQIQTLHVINNQNFQFIQNSKLSKLQTVNFSQQYFLLSQIPSIFIQNQYTFKNKNMIRMYYTEIQNTFAKQIKSFKTQGVYILIVYINVCLVAIEVGLILTFLDFVQANPKYEHLDNQNYDIYPQNMYRYNLM